MAWGTVELCDILQANENLISLNDLSKYEYAVLSPYPNGLISEGKKRGLDFRGKQHQIVRAGQFIISTIDMDRRLWGIVPPELDQAIVRRSYVCFDIHDNISRSYFAAYLSTQQFYAKVSSARTRAGHLSIRDFSSIEMPNPSYGEQQQIAEIWEWMYRVLHRTDEEYQGLMDLKLDIAADLFHNSSVATESNVLTAWAVIGHDDNVPYPVYMTTNGQPTKTKPQLADTLIGIMPNSELDGQFLYYYLENLKQVGKISHNLLQRNLQNAIETLPLTLPTLYEQRKIATLLKQHDEALRKVEVEQKELRYLTEGLIELVFTNKLPSQEALSLLRSF